MLQSALGATSQSRFRKSPNDCLWNLIVALAFKGDSPFVRRLHTPEMVPAIWTGPLNVKKTNLRGRLPTNSPPSTSERPSARAALAVPSPRIKQASSGLLHTAFARPSVECQAATPILLGASSGKIGAASSGEKPPLMSPKKAPSSCFGGEPVAPPPFKGSHPPASSSSGSGHASEAKPERIQLEEEDGEDVEADWRQSQ